MKNEIRTQVRAFALLVVAVFITATMPNPGYWWPVVTDFQIISRYPTPDGRIGVDVEFTKARDCKFIGQDIDIRLFGDTWTEARIIYPEDGGQPVNSKYRGRWRASWVIDIPSTFLDSSIRASVRHQCWGPLLWTTITTELGG